jgi:uncharacterized integral membrane protein
LRRTLLAARVQVGYNTRGVGSVPGGPWPAKGQRGGESVAEKRGSVVRQVSLLLVALVIAAACILIVQNKAPVAMRFLMVTRQVSLQMVLLCATGASFIAGMLARGIVSKRK